MLTEARARDRESGGFHNVVVPVDLTDRHRRTLSIAAELAGHEQGKVLLLHVIELPSGMTPEDEPEFFGRLERKAARRLDCLGRELDARGVPWSAEVLFGRRTETVVRRATETGADLLLLTSHCVDPERPGAGWSTPSYQLGILARCAVLLVK